MDKTPYTASVRPRGVAALRLANHSHSCKKRRWQNPTKCYCPREGRAKELLDMEHLESTLWVTNKRPRLRISIEKLLLPSPIPRHMIVPREGGSDPSKTPITNSGANALSGFIRTALKINLERFNRKLIQSQSPRNHVPLNAAKLFTNGFTRGPKGKHVLQKTAYASVQDIQAPLNT